MEKDYSNELACLGFLEEIAMFLKSISKSLDEINKKLEDDKYDILSHPKGWSI